MNDSFSFSPSVWWFITGILLILAEFMIPGLVVVFFGVAALLVSLIAYLGWVDAFSAQLLLFVILSLTLLFSLRWLVKGWFVGDSEKASESDSLSDYVGNEAICLSDFSAREPYGKVEYKGAVWKAKCDSELSKGSRAVIRSVDGLCLQVEPLE
ncbi:MAG: NfeD family protein [Verrucomicrobiota bacterium]